MTSFDHMTFLKAPSSNTVTLGARTSAHELGAETESIALKAAVSVPSPPSVSPSCFQQEFKQQIRIRSRKEILGGNNFLSVNLVYLIITVKSMKHIPLQKGGKGNILMCSNSMRAFYFSLKGSGGGGEAGELLPKESAPLDPENGSHTDWQD